MTEQYYLKPDGTWQNVKLGSMNQRINCNHDWRWRAPMKCCETQEAQVCAKCGVTRRIPICRGYDGTIEKSAMPSR